PTSKLSVPSRAAGEAGDAFARLAGVDRRLAQHELARERGGEIEAGAFVDGAAIAQHTARGEGRDLTGQRLCSRTRLANGNDTVGEANTLGLARVHGTPGEDQVERAAHPDQPWQPHVAAVYQRDTPAAAEHAEDGILLDDAEVAPQRELEAA